MRHFGKRVLEMMLTLLHEIRGSVTLVRRSREGKLRAAISGSNKSTQNEIDRSAGVHFCDFEKVDDFGKFSSTEGRVVKALADECHGDF